MKGSKSVCFGMKLPQGQGVTGWELLQGCKIKE